MHCNLKLLWKKVHVWYFVASRVVIFPVYCHPVYFISVYISGEVPPLSFRQMPNIVYIHDPPPVTFCIFPLIWHSISIWCYIFYKISFHFGARDYILCYNFMFGYLCTCTRSNKKNLIKNDEKHHFSKMLSWHVIPRMLICYIIDRWAVLLCL